MGRRWFPAAEMDRVLWMDNGGDSPQRAVPAGLAIAPGWQQSPAASRPPSHPLSQAIVSWQMETSNGCLTSAHNPDVIVEIGSPQDPLYRKEAGQGWLISCSLAPRR